MPTDPGQQSAYDAEAARQELSSDRERALQDQIERLQKELEAAKLTEAKSLQDALRDAKPAAIKDGQPLFPSPVPRRTEDEVRRIDASRGSVTRSARQPFFPEEEPTAAVTQVTQDALSNIAFLLRDATTTEMDVTVHKIAVYDGEINGELPTGMGGPTDLTLTPDDPNDAYVIAEVAFDPSSLAITSRTVNVYQFADIPESRVESSTTGFLYWQLGYAYLDNTSFVIVQTWLGDINFAFTYGANNGKPALLPVHSNPGWIDLDAIFP